MSSTRLDVAVFDGKSDFDIWKKKMKVLLSHHKAHWALEKELEKWPEALKAKKSEVDEQAYNLLFMNLSDTVIRKVDGADTALKLWVKLESIYSNKSAPSLAFLKGSLFSWKMDSQKSIDENIDEFLKITLLLKGTDQALDETSMSMIILNSIPESFQVVKDIFQYSTSLPSFDQICSALKTRELELKNQNRSSSGSGLYVNNKTASSTNKSSKKKKMFDSDTGEREPRKCYHCGKAGHVKKNCYAWKKSKGSETNETNVATAGVADVEISEVLNVCRISRHDQWILDSGCDFHMCPNKEWFEDFQEVVEEDVYLGDDRPCEVLGVGSVKFVLESGKRVTLTRVRYIPSLKRNLISLGVLDDLGCVYEVSSGKMNVFRNGNLVLSGTKFSNLYVLDGSHDSASRYTCLLDTNHAAKTNRQESRGVLYAVIDNGVEIKVEPPKEFVAVPIEVEPQEVAENPENDVLEPSQDLGSNLIVDLERDACGGQTDRIDLGVPADERVFRDGEIEATSASVKLLSSPLIFTALLPEPKVVVEPRKGKKRFFHDMLEDLRVMGKPKKVIGLQGSRSIVLIILAYCELLKFVDFKFRFISNMLAIDVIKLFQVPWEANYGSDGSERATDVEFNFGLNSWHVE